MASLLSVIAVNESGAFSAFMRLPQAAILSLSPERFLALNQQQVETKPIKGTRPRFIDPIADQASIKELLQSPKDRAENLMIVDLLRNGYWSCLQTRNRART